MTVYVCVTLYVHLKNDVFPIFFPSPLNQDNAFSLTNVVIYCLYILTVSYLHTKGCDVCAFQLGCQIQKTQAYTTNGKYKNV